MLMYRPIFPGISSLKAGQSSTASSHSMSGTQNCQGWNCTELKALSQSMMPIPTAAPTSSKDRSSSGPKMKSDWLGFPSRIPRIPEPTEWTSIPTLFQYNSNSRGVGLADMAQAVMTGREHRANGDMAFHALEVMHGFYTASEKGEYYTLKSSFTRPPADGCGPSGIHPGLVDRKSLSTLFLRQTRLSGGSFILPSRPGHFRIMCREKRENHRRRILPLLFSGRLRRWDRFPPPPVRGNPVRSRGNILFSE